VTPTTIPSFGGWDRYLGLDVHAASCTVTVISEKGRKHRDFPVETNGQVLVEAIRMVPGHKHLVFEEGLLSTNVGSYSGDRRVQREPFMRAIAHSVQRLGIRA